jgi:hypothetical protein
LHLVEHGKWSNPWFQTYVTPGATAIANIGWKYYLLFMCLTVISIIVIYFFYPETKKRSLEELAAYFGETVISDPVAALEKLENHSDMLPEKTGDRVQHAERMS